MSIRKKNNAGSPLGRTNSKGPAGEAVETVNSNIQNQYKKISPKNKRKKYLPATDPQADKTIASTVVTNTKCNCSTCRDSRYEEYNIMKGDSIYSPPFEELKGGKIFVSLDAISATEKEELGRRFGPWVNNKEDVSE